MAEKQAASRIFFVLCLEPPPPLQICNGFPDPSHWALEPQRATSVRSPDHECPHTVLGVSGSSSFLGCQEHFLLVPLPWGAHATVWYIFLCGKSFSATVRQSNARPRGACRLPASLQPSTVRFLRSPLHPVVQPRPGQEAARCPGPSQSGRARSGGGGTIEKMPDVKERAARKDPGVAEGGSCDPSQAGQAEKNERSSPELPSSHEVSKQSSEIGMNHDFHVEEKTLSPSRSSEDETKDAPHSRLRPLQKAGRKNEELRQRNSRLEGKTKETMPNDFWDHLKEQLSAIPPDFSCALELLKEIREVLLSLLLPRQNRLRSEIEEALDMDFLSQQAERGDLNIHYLSKYILNMMVLLCAPVRDEAVQRLENITDPVRLLRGIFQVLGLMKMDMVNYTIQSLQPQLQEHSIQYERAKFQEQLNKQPGLLNHTTKWLTQAAADLTMPPPSYPDTADSSGAASPSPNEAAINPEPPSPAMVLSQGFLNLLLWDPENEEFPETLLMDRTRLQELEAQLSQLVISASVLLVASSFSGSVLFGSPQFVDKLKRITKSQVEEFNTRPEEAMLTVSEQVAQEIHQSLKNMGLAALSSDNTASLIGQLQNIAQKENCVRSVIDQRIHLFLKCCLVLGVQRSLLDLPGGLALIEAELAELGQKFVNLTHHNQQVFGPYYTEILKTLVSPAQSLTAKVESL